MTQELKKAIFQLFARIPRPFYTGKKTESECKQDCADWRAEMISIKNLEVFQSFIEQPSDFKVGTDQSVSGYKLLPDSPEVNRKYVESQITNQKQLRKNMQKKIQNCNRKVWF